MSVSAERFRVSADFLPAERDALDALCKADYRPTAEQIRWLVMNEAQRRGLLSAEQERAAESDRVHTPNSALVLDYGAALLSAAHLRTENERLSAERELLERQLHTVKQELDKHLADAEATRRRNTRAEPTP